MKKAIKNFLVILCASGILFSACACQNGGENDISQTDLQSPESIPADETVPMIEKETETSEAVITSLSEETTSKDYQPLTVIHVKQEVEESEDTILAMNFSIDINKSLILGDPSLVDKYFDNEYLKEYVRDCLEWKIRTDKGSYSGEFVASAKIYSVEEVEGINYVNVYYFDVFHANSHFGTAKVGGSIVGIRNGKIVNIISAPGIERFQYCIYGWPSKSPDNIHKPNPWDDEEVAQRAIKAFKMYANEEYPYFQAAWDSLGE